MTGPEIHDPELLAYATRIASKVLKLSLVAAEAMEMVVDRYVIGQQRYGEPDIEGRDWLQELEEDMIDPYNYVPLLLIAQRRRRQRQAAQARIDYCPDVVHIPAREFDVSDVEIESSFVVDSGIVTELP